MPNERPDERPGWKQKLDDPEALPLYTLDDKAASWERLYTRLDRRRSFRRLLPWSRLVAACLLLALLPAIYHFSSTLPKGPASDASPSEGVSLSKNVPPSKSTSPPMNTSPSERKTLPSQSNTPQADIPALPGKPLSPGRAHMLPPHVPPVTPGPALAMRRATPPPFSTDRPPAPGNMIPFPCPDSLPSPVLALAKAPISSPANRLRVVHINELHDPTGPGAAVTKTRGIFSFRNNSIFEISLSSKNR